MAGLITCRSCRDEAHTFDPARPAFHNTPLFAIIYGATSRHVPNF